MRDLIEAQNRKFSAAVMGNQGKEVASFYTEQTKFAPPNAVYYIGRYATEKWWQENLAQISDLRYQTLTVSGDEYILYETGKAFMRPKAHASLGIWQVAKYNRIWRKQSDGRFLIDVDFWNSHQPETLKEAQLPVFR